MPSTINQVAFIDDDDVLRDANVQTLQLAGFEVLAFSEAETALTALPPSFPGVVVSDIRMPGMDGRQLFRRLKEQDGDLPVILITGHADVTEAGLERGRITECVLRTLRRLPRAELPAGARLWVVLRASNTMAAGMREVREAQQGAGGAP